MLPPPPPQTLFRPYPFFRLREERRTTRNEISCLRSQRDNTVWSRTPTPMRLHLVQTEAGSSKAKSVLTRCEHFNSIATRNVFAYIKMHQFFSCKSKVSLTRRDFLIEYGLVHHFMMAPDRTIWMTLFPLFMQTVPILSWRYGLCPCLHWPTLF